MLTLESVLQEAVICPLSDTTPESSIMEHAETFKEWHLNVGGLLAPAKVGRAEGEKPLKEADIPS